MEVESAKVLDNGRRILVDLKRKRTARCMADVTGAGACLEAKYSALGSVPAMLCKQMKSDECYVSSNFGSYVKKSFLRNYSNFVKSGLPQRVLFYENGEWSDIPDFPIGNIKDDFQLKKAAIEVEFRGSLFLLDFLHMLLVELKTGLQQPLAWIDEGGCCFFPEVYADGEEPHDCPQSGGRVSRTVSSENETHEIKLQLEIEVNADDSSKMEECSEESNTHVKQFITDDTATHPYVQGKNASNDTKEVGGHRSVDSSPPLGPVFEFMDRSMTPDTVKSMFFKGIGASLGTKNIFGIQRSSSYWAEARFEIFKKQVEITTKYRGNANVRYAWLASSKEAGSRILMHGLGFDELPKRRPACGVGIHLSTENYSRISASYSDVDENGIQHLVLCRVILGNMEVIPHESRKFNPNKETYDSAVDDLQDPKHYLIWNTNMSTNIFPEYVVSFKMPLQGKGPTVSEGSGISSSISQEKLLSSSLTVDSVQNRQQSPDSVEISQRTNSTLTFAERPPTSPWMPFPLLFAALEEKISVNAMKMLDLFYDKFRKKELSRDDFVKKLRWITGDKVLRDTILMLQGQLPGRELPISKQDPSCESPVQNWDPSCESTVAKQGSARESSIMQNRTMVCGALVTPKQEQGA